jgi:hypothetical protein
MAYVIYIALSSEVKTHVLAGVDPGDGGRQITTVCGLVHPEADFRYTTESDENLCSRCGGKVDIPEPPAAEEVVVDTYPAPVVESVPDKAPAKSTTTKTSDK